MLMTKVKDLSDNPQSISKHDINDVMDDLSKIYLEAAEETFGIRRVNNTMKKRNREKISLSRPWFSSDCRIARKKNIEKVWESTSSIERHLAKVQKRWTWL